MGKMPFIWWQGVVEDNNDPLMLGRCRVRVLGFHNSDKGQLPTEHLPWATTIQPVTSAAVSGIGTSPTGILSGTWVIGFFRDGEFCQEPVIMGTLAGIPQERRLGTDGFSDPNEQYPKDDMLGEADTNRLARNENIEKTIVHTKNINLQKDVFAALDAETWSEPKSPYDAKYPKNHVMETESGHVQEFDDTPDKERIHTYHKAGTFQEIHPDGTTVRKIVGDNYEIVLGDGKILIRGTKTENIDGNNNLKVGGNLNVQIVGDVNLLIEGNSTTETKGDHFHKVGGVYSVVSDGNMSFLAPRIDLNPNGSSPGDIGGIFKS